MLEHLTRLNDGILSIMGTNMQREIHRATQETTRAVLELYNKVDDLDQLVKALQLELGQKKENAKSSRMFLDDEENMNFQQVDQLTELATFKSFNQSINERQESFTTDQSIYQDKTLTGTEWLSLNPIDIEISYDSNEPCTADRATRCRAIYRASKQEKLPVWIEWKYYERSRGKLGPEPLVLERLQKLAILLHNTSKPVGFRVPHCIGYFDESTNNDVRYRKESADCRIGFVFKYPEAAALAAQPITLLQLFRTCQAGEEPSLTARIELARILTAALSCLHSVNWLHKGLRSGNIVFFPDKGRKGGVNLSKPYLCGFEFSRPSSRDEMTELPPQHPEFDVYRHPHAHGQSPGTSFRKAYDIYSIGVILVEIAHWRSIDQVLEIENLRTARPTITRRVREKLLMETTMKHVAARAGVHYQNVIQACIDGSLECTSNESDGDAMGALLLSEAFHEKVIRSLNELRC